jgi:hypothetical protein
MTASRLLTAAAGAAIALALLVFTPVAAHAAPSDCSQLPLDSQQYCNDVWQPCTYRAYLPNAISPCKPCNEVQAQPYPANKASCDPNVWRDSDGKVVPR